VPRGELGAALRIGDSTSCQFHGETRHCAGSLDPWGSQGCSPIAAMNPAIPHPVRKQGERDPLRPAACSSQGSCLGKPEKTIDRSDGWCLPRPRSATRSSRPQVAQSDSLEPRAPNRRAAGLRNRCRADAHSSCVERAAMHPRNCLSRASVAVSSSGSRRAFPSITCLKHRRQATRPMFPPVIPSRPLERRAR
jgi:hypothetical protein